MIVICHWNVQSWGENTSVYLMVVFAVWSASLVQQCLSPSEKGPHVSGLLFWPKPHPYSPPSLKAGWLQFPARISDAFSLFTHCATSLFMIQNRGDRTEVRLTFCSAALLLDDF